MYVLFDKYSLWAIFMLNFEYIDNRETDICGNVDTACITANNPKLFFLMLLLLLFSGPQHNKAVVCYISTWAVYRPDRGSYSIDNFDPNLCTIAIYAFAGLDIANDAIKSLGE